MDSPFDTNYQFKPDEKKAFAAALLANPKSPFEAAITVFGPSATELGRASYAATYWPQDREVIAFQQDLLKNNGAANFLPTKETASLRVWEWTNIGPTEDRIKAMKLYCEMNDFIAKPGANVSVYVNNRVMEVPVSKSDEDWEREAAASQEKLVRDAIAIH